MPWQSMDTAPRDGTPIQVEIPGHGSDNVIAWLWGYLDSDGNYCGAWTVMDEQEPPDDWDDGVCWEVNGDEIPSTQPTRWKPLSWTNQETPPMRSHEAILSATAEIVRLREAMRKAANIIDANLYHQREKVEDASTLLKQALNQ